jgi:hypothetical protein
MMSLKDLKEHHYKKQGGAHLKKDVLPCDIWPKGHWPKGHLRLLSLDLKFKGQEWDVTS